MSEVAPEHQAIQVVLGGWSNDANVGWLALLLTRPAPRATLFFKENCGSLVLIDIIIVNIVRLFRMAI